MSENTMKQSQDPEQSSISGQNNSQGPEFDLDYIKNTATKLVMEPEAAWAELNQSSDSIRSMFMRYGVFLFAVPAICNIITNVKFSFPGAIIYGLFTFGAALGMSYLAGFFLQVLSIKFDGKCSLEDGVKLALFSATPQFLAPIIGLLPSIPFSLLSAVVSLYAIRIFWLGIPILTGVPQEKRMSFFLSFLGCMLVCGIILSAIAMPLMPQPDVISSMPFQ